VSAVGGALPLGAGWRAALASLESAATQAEPKQETMNASVRNQVLDAIARGEGLSNGRGTLRLQLDPAHLGRIEVTFRRLGDVLEISLRAETPEVERILRDGAETLSQALLTRGGGWNQVQVNVSAETADDADEDADEEENRESGRDRDPEHEDADPQQEGGEA
jgi:flagellar hook-length control protein FliK